MSKLDKSTFEKIIKESYQMIYNLGLRLFNYNKQDTEDFVQDVYLQIYENYSSYLNKSKINTWIYSVALNLGLNKIKKSKKLQKTMQTQIHESIDSSKISDTQEIEDLPENLKIKVQEQLIQLPEIYRLPLVLYYYEKLTYKEMSKKLNIPEGTLKSLVYRGKLILREKLLKIKEHL
ncbi:MAG: RNA polymerase sigma factor [Leptonema sp. (in: bacteria)]